MTLEPLESRVMLSALPGDTTGDGRVDFADFVVVSNHFGQAASKFQGDMDGNRFVDFADFTLLAANFGMAVPSGIYDGRSVVSQDDVWYVGPVDRGSSITPSVPAIFAVP